MAQSTQVRITASEYFQRPEYAEHDLIQLIDGEVVIGMPPVPKHQDIVREILIMFGLTARQKGGKAYASPIEIYLDEHHVYEPDVLYLKPDSACEVGEKRLTGPPDLVVEVLSPSTAKYDRYSKYQAYERFGVGEYWIVDAANELIEVWTRDDDGRFEQVGGFARGDTFKSITLDQDVEVAAIFVL